LESRTGPRIRGHTVTPAEKAQAHDVSLRRISTLFVPHRWSIAGVTAIIVVSSVLGMASPFLLRAVIDTALPTQNVTLLSWLGGCVGQGRFVETTPRGARPAIFEQRRAVASGQILENHIASPIGRLKNPML